MIYVAVTVADIGSVSAAHSKYSSSELSGLVSRAIRTGGSTAGGNTCTE